MLRRLAATALIVVQALVPAYAADTTYYFRDTHTGSGLIGQASTTPVTEPSEHDIPVQTLAAVQGNVSGPAIASLSVKTALNAIASKIDGGVGAVVYDSVAPEVPGLSFDANTGVVSGVPTIAYKGTVVVSYHDTSNNVGQVDIPVEVYPHPALVSSKDSFDLPRLASADAYGIQVSPANEGFYAGVVYSLAPGSAPLPAGLSISNGLIVGKTTVPGGVNYPVTIRGTSVANPGVYADKTITLDIVPDQAMSLVLAPSPVIWQLDTTAKKVTKQDLFAPKPTPRGTFTAPVTWSLSDAPDWMTIGTDGQLGGTPPAVGSYTATVQAKDADGTTATAPAAVSVIAAGYIFASPGGYGMTVRNGEDWQTPVQTATGFTGPYTFTQYGMPSDVSLDPSTGVFSGKYAISSTENWHMMVKDNVGHYSADGALGNTNYYFGVTSVPPLSLGAQTNWINGIQNSTPLFVQWPKAKNIIGNVTYTVTGNVPGSLFYKYYDNNDTSQLATYIGTDGTTVRQLAGETSTDTHKRMPVDSIVFDTVLLQLSGVPSQNGTFNIALLATDDHQDTGYLGNRDNPNRISDNTARSSNLTLNVRSHAVIATTANGPTQTLSQFTTKSTIVTSLKEDVTNIPWTAGNKWVLSSGTVPPGLTPTVSSDTSSISYVGYPTTTGSYQNIVWKVTDNSGNVVTTPAVGFTVGPRLALALTSSQGPTPTLYLGAAPNLTVTPTNVANGDKLDASAFTVTGTLPAGVSYDVSNGVLSFTGKPTASGVYKGIVVSVTDSQNGKANVSLDITINGSIISINFGGGDQVLNQFTSKPTLTTAIFDGPSNTRYTKGVVWTKVSGTIPPGITATVDPVDSGSMNYAGYPSEQGKWDNIVWQAAASDGSVINTLPASFTVGPRAALTLTSDKGTAVTIAASTDDAATTITASNVPNGAAIPSGNWVVTGTLPTGVTWKAGTSSIVFSGKSTSRGTFPLTISATDALGGTASLGVTFTVSSALGLVNTKGSAQTISNQVQTASLSTTLRTLATSANYTAGATWTLASGALPPGITATLSSDKSTLTYGGYPSVEGTYPNITYSVVAADGSVLTTPPITFTVSPKAGLQLSSTQGANRQMRLNTDDAATTVFAVNPVNGIQPSLTSWTVTGGLPTGLTWTATSAGVVFSGVPTAISTSSVTVTGTDSSGTTASWVQQFQVVTNVSLIVWDSASQTVAEFTGQPVYSFSVRAPGNYQYTAGVTWTVSAGTLPPGVTLDVSAYSGGAPFLKGYPTALGTYSGIVFTGTTAEGTQISTPGMSIVVGPRATFKIASNLGSAKRTMQPSTDDAATTIVPTNNASGVAITAANWQVSGTLPTGVSKSVTTTGLVFSGKSSVSGTYPLTITATDSSGVSATYNFTFVVAAFTPPFTQSWYTTYSGTTKTTSINLTAVTGAAPVVSLRYSVPSGTVDFMSNYVLYSGALPPGLTFYCDNSGVCLFSGNATTPGTYNVVYAVTDRDGYTGFTPQLTINVANRTALAITQFPSVVKVASGTGTVNTTVTATGGLPLGTSVANGQISWQVIGYLPYGVTWAVSAGKAVFSGKPIQSGDNYIHIIGTDTTGATADSWLELNTTINWSWTGVNAFNVDGTASSANPANVYCYQSYCYYIARTETLKVGQKSAMGWYTNDNTYPINSASVYSGTLPPGMGVVANGSIYFTGTPTKAGTYGPIQIRATDSKLSSDVLPSVTFIVQ